MNLPELDKDGKLPAYAWPGGCPIIYLDGYNEILCADCATENLTRDKDDKSRTIAGDVYYEGPSVYCFDCNAEIESAYGDPKETDE